MTTDKNVAYYEEQLRPQLPSISDPNHRTSVEDLLVFTDKKEKEKLEAPTGKQRPRPGGNELEAIKNQLGLNVLQAIEHAVGANVRGLIQELLQYAEQLVAELSN